MGTVKIIYITISKNYKTNWTKLGVPANEMNFLHIYMAMFSCYRKSSADISTKYISFRRFQVQTPICLFFLRPNSFEK